MKELYPIIRRKRRPLVVEDAPAVVVGSVEPVKVEAAVSREANEGGEGKNEILSDAHATQST